MNTKKIIAHWIESSDRDYETMLHLFQTKDYHWALYVGHLVIEKLLKAYYVKKLNEHPPFIHNLRRLAEKSGLELNEEQIDFFVTVTGFNLNARYEDYKLKFYKMCTKKFTELWFNKIKEYRKWVKEQLLKS